MAARWLKPLAVLSAALAITAIAPRTASAQAAVTGRVTSQDGEPVAEARVLLMGTALSAVSGQDGRYAIRNAPTGPQTVRVLRVGYKEQKKAATIGVNAMVGVDFVLERSVVQLEEIVSTATGARPREELGNSVASLSATTITGTTVSPNIQDVLSARVPGVQVQTGQQTGSGGKVRIRGNSSLNLSNDPIYVIDGIRLTSNVGSSSLFTGGSQPVRVNDINPEEIENIEIVKGPSAATLYGTDAANGVIVITTKRGRAGATRWNAYAEGGILEDYTEYPLNYTIAGHSPGLTAYRECTLSTIASGACVMDSVRTYSPLRDPDASPVGTGYRNQVGLSASGGNEAVRYFLSGEREDEIGHIRLPEFERRRMLAANLPIRDYTQRPNTLEKYSTRANLNASPSPVLDLSFSSGLINSKTNFVPESNATVGLGSQIYGGKGYKDNGNISGFEAGTPTSPLTGYRAWTPGYTFQELLQQKVTRVISSGSADWRPTSWMQNRATLGVDYTSRLDNRLLRRGDGPPINATYRLGFAEDNRNIIRNLSFDVGSTSTWRPREAMAVRSTLGMQYVNYYSEANSATGSQLAPGTQTPNSGSIPGASSGTTLNKTLGFFIEEQVGMRDRLFVTGALRSDQNSAFGTKFQNVLYPKLSASWIASDEAYFPTMSWLDQLRMRIAYGKSGVQPGSNDALRSFAGTTGSYRATDVPSVIFNAVGNDLLKPERTSEIEFGFDIRLLQRANLELTYYSKMTADALISAIVAPSAGAAVNVQRNLGSVKNAGFEGLVSATVLDRPAIALDFSLTASINHNKLVKMGKDEAGNPIPAVVGTTTRAQPGFPLFGFWARPITGWEDKDGNGILTYSADANLNEVFVGADTIYRGYSNPPYAATFLPAIDLFNRSLRVSTLFEYKGGHRYYNNTERIRCASRQNCNGLMNPNATFEEQAMAIAHLVDPSTTLDGFFQPGSFVRWRELSATYTLPSSIVGRYIRGAERASVNFAARNLHLWTKYRGLDPEIDFQAGESANGAPSEFQTMGTPTYFVFRLNLGF
jgi:TonB-linked SusC/RagA family outer membrane protein